MKLTTEFTISEDVEKQLLIKDGVTIANVISCSAKSIKLDVKPPFSVEYDISFSPAERKLLVAGASIMFEGNKAVSIIPTKEIKPAVTPTKQGFCGKLPQG